MQEELLKRLDALAAKLGVAAEHLWDVLVRQGQIEGMRGVVLAVVGFVVMLIAGRKAARAFRENRDDATMGWVILCFLSGGAALVGQADAWYLLNPEYFALRQLLELLK